MPVKRPRRAGETVFAVALLGFSLAAFWQAFRISGFSGLSTAGVFPMLAAGAMAISAMVILVRTLSLPRAAGQQGTTWQDFCREVLPRRHVAMLALILLYLLSMPWVGFVVGSGVFLFVAFAALWRRGIMLSLLLTVVCLGAIYLVFRVVFQVVLPQGSLIPDSLLRGLF